MTAPTELTVLCCREPGSVDGPGQGAEPATESAVPRSGHARRAGGGHGADAHSVRDILVACAGWRIHYVGPRPGKQIDPLLAGRVLVVGGDADLAAVVLRMLRKDLLGEVQVAYATPRDTAVTAIWSLPTGAAAVATAEHAEVDLVPLVRSDAGGVLVGAAQLSPVSGTAYVDSERVLSGGAQVVQVEPDREKGLAVTVVRKRVLGFGRRPVTRLGRAVEFGLVGDTAIVCDGVRHPRKVNRWVFYKHTEPLRLIRGVY